MQWVVPRCSFIYHRFRVTSELVCALCLPGSNATITQASALRYLPLLPPPCLAGHGGAARPVAEDSGVGPGLLSLHRGRLRGDARACPLADERAGGGRCLGGEEGGEAGLRAPGTEGSSAEGAGCGRRAGMLTSGRSGFTTFMCGVSGGGGEAQVHASQSGEARIGGGAVASVQAQDCAP